MPKVSITIGIQIDCRNALCTPRQGEFPALRAFLTRGGTQPLKTRKSFSRNALRIRIHGQAFSEPVFNPTAEVPIIQPLFSSTCGYGFMRFWLLILTFVCGLAAGCGTTRWSDTPRTATEQLLLSDATDRAVSQIDFNTIAGSNIYLDSSPIRQTVDSAYLTSSIRQHLMASDCIIKDKAEEADYVIEIRAGAMGTDRRDLLVGIPATSVPSVGATGTGSTIIPEIPIAKRTEQRAVAKIAVFAYDRETGRPVWQSGTIPVESKARDLWVLGAGPFQRGNIYKGTKFAGQTLPSIDISKEKAHDNLQVTQEVIFADSRELLAMKQQRRQAQVVPPYNGPAYNGPVPPPHIDAIPAGAPGVRTAARTEVSRTPPVQPEAVPSPVAVPPAAAPAPQPASPQAAESMSFPFTSAVPWNHPSAPATQGTHQSPSFKFPFLGS